jgi:cell division protein FtsB
MAFRPASPEKQRAAYEAQQAAMAEREAETTRQMEALVEQYDAAGETEKADFWRDYLAERSG